MLNGRKQGEGCLLGPVDPQFLAIHTDARTRSVPRFLYNPRLPSRTRTRYRSGR